MAAGVVGKLDVADGVPVGLHGDGDIAFHDLHMVDVVLEHHVRPIDLCDYLQGVVGPVDEEAGYVPGVDGLDHDGGADFGGLIGCILEVFHEGVLQGDRVRAIGDHPGQCGNAGAVQRPGVLARAADAVPELAHAVRHYRDAPLAAGPVACGKIEEHLLEAVAIQGFLDGGCVEVVREQVLDALEAGPGGCVEPVHHVDLVEHHR